MSDYTHDDAMCDLDDPLFDPPISPDWDWNLRKTRLTAYITRIERERDAAVAALREILLLPNDDSAWLIADAALAAYEEAVGA